MATIYVARVPKIIFLFRYIQQQALIISSIYIFLCVNNIPSHC